MPQTEKDRVLQAIADVAAEKAGTDADMFNEGYAIHPAGRAAPYPSVKNRLIIYQPVFHHFTII